MDRGFSSAFRVGRAFFGPLSIIADGGDFTIPGCCPGLVDDTEFTEMSFIVAPAQMLMQGDAARAAFSRQGELANGEHYVFVVDTQGTMFASGGGLAVLIGRDVSTVLEPKLRTTFAKVLASEEVWVETAEYRWMNLRDVRVERKQVYYQRVGERIIAVGHYLPHATSQQA